VSFIEIYHEGLDEVESRRYPGLVVCEHHGLGEDIRDHLQAFHTELFQGEGVVFEGPFPVLVQHDFQIFGLGLIIRLTHEGLDPTDEGRLLNRVKSEEDRCPITEKGRAAMVPHSHDERILCHPAAHLQSPQVNAFPETERAGL
jgi:hypothetical protein